MEKYYILSVDSFQDTFTKIDATKSFLFKFAVQDNENILDSIVPGDVLLIYRRAPLSGTNIYLKVVSRKNGSIKVEKKLEVSKLVSVDIENINVEKNYLTEITKEQFNKICKKMISEIINDQNQLDEKDSKSMREKFKQYILNVLNLKSIRQVTELEKTSDKMIEAGIIKKDIYYISDVEEYKKIVQDIKDSDEYKEYKFEHKAKNPHSGLILDQGITNYGKFLVYLSQNTENIKRVTGAENILFYGVPGVGKSHEIETKYCSDEKFMERVVFHPDYTYSDFVGQILPRIIMDNDGNDKLKYVFTPGPFTKLLKKAKNDPENYYYLVIEELNRGNASAIFGDIFQLLDRKDEDGESKYGISNYDIANVVYHDENQLVRIPSNMFILATMNTADQNVFTLDTAFQRRWNMKQIENRFDKSKHSKDMIEGTKVDWGSFATVINDIIINTNIDMVSFEDKRLGVYFAKKKELKVDKFPEKVLKYLWDDAFKMNHTEIFNENLKSLEDVIIAYETTTKDKLEEVLRLNVYEKMISKMSENGLDQED